MADATATPTTINPRYIQVEMPTRPPNPRYIAVKMPTRPLRVPQAPTPLPIPEQAIQGKRDRAANLPPINPGKVRAAQQAKRQQWESLSLRQVWADAAFMRGHLKVAGVKVAASTEPATVPRMKEKLRAIGIHSPEIQEAIGMPLGRFLKVNPGLPLWAALALVLESIGRFTPEGFAGGTE